ncbi:MAG: hypothetical protein ABI432_07190 [Flavobacteriales bacterium]
MELRFSFKPGSRQSLEASRYFTLLGADLLNAHLPPYEPLQFLLTEDHGSPLPLRIWTAQPHVRYRLGILIPWVRQVSEGMRALGRYESDVQEVMEFITAVMATRHAEETAFVESLNPEHAFTPDEDNELSIGLVGGETVMLSARNVMFTKISSGLFGLSVARMGSFLIEQVGRAEVMHVHVHRA